MRWIVPCFNLRISLFQSRDFKPDVVDNYFFSTQIIEN